MDRKIIGALLLVLATCGCCACDNSCDYLPPVLDGPYSSHGTRSGSVGNMDYPTPLPVEAHQPVEGQPITPLEVVE